MAGNSEIVVLNLHRIIRVALQALPYERTCSGASAEHMVGRARCSSAERTALGAPV